MVTSEQPLVRTETGRVFACSPAAVLVFIINDQEQFLMLRHPQRDGWEVVNGALDAAETVLDGALREVAEEAGPDVRVRPLGAVHIQTFHYDRAARYMLSLSMLAAYEGGEITPGDDMAGSEVAWFSLEQLQDERTPVLVPPSMRWMFARALQLYRLWRDERVPLQRSLERDSPNKYSQMKSQATGG